MDHAPLGGVLIGGLGARSSPRIIWDILSEVVVACFHPLTAWRPLKSAPDQRPVFAAELSCAPEDPFPLPCGGCIGCHETHQGEWVTRLMLESKEYEPDQVWFVTCTLANEHLSDDFSVSKHDMKLFVRRVRNSVGGSLGLDQDEKPQKFKFYCRAEYGDDERFTRRPHYHFLFFGLSLPDLMPFGKSKSGFTQWVSPWLEEVWGKGMVEVGLLEVPSVSYVAGYMHAKFRPKGVTRAARAAEYREHYLRDHPLTGELVVVRPEFTLCSQGIGLRWCRRFEATDLQGDFVVRDGKRLRMPRYFVKKRIAWDDDPLARAELEKAKRREFAMRPQAVADATPERLRTREAAKHLARIELVRSAGAAPERYLPGKGTRA